MEEPSSLGSLRITGSNMILRELREVAVVTDGALVGGQLMPNGIKLRRDDRMISNALSEPVLLWAPRRRCAR
jgi:hypothetical protein